jgi:hypothetical protein
MAGATGLVALRRCAMARKGEEASDYGRANAAESVEIQRRKLGVEIADLQA